MNAALVTLNQFGASFVNHAGSMFLQAGILIALLWALDRVLRRRLRASLRYGLWMLILVKLTLPPSFSLPTGVGSWTGRIGHRVAGILPAHVEDVHRVAGVSPARVEGDSPSLKNQPAWNRDQSLLQTSLGAGREAEDVPVRIAWPGALLVGWLLGVSVLGSALLVRAFSLRRIVRRAEPPGEAMLSLLAQCQHEVGLATYVNLKLTRDLSGPAVCRIWRPVILVPKALTDSLPEDKQRAILIHELCHIKRADPWVNLAQTLLQVFYFYNPLVWLANASIRRVREQAVDERVLVCLKGQLQCYSHTLIDIAAVMTLRARLGIGLIGVLESKTRLNERIELMLHRPTPHNAGLGIKGLAALVALGCALLPMAAAGGAGASTDAAFTPADAQTADKLLGDIRTAYDAFAGAFNSGRTEAMMTFLANDVMTMAPGAPAVVGADALRQQYEHANADGIRIMGLTEQDRRIWMCGDLIYTTRHHTLITKRPDGSTAAEARCGVAIWQRQKDDSLKLKLEAYNRVDGPARPAPEHRRQLIAEATDYNRVDSQDRPAKANTTVYRCTANSPTLPPDAKLYDQIRDLERRFERLFTENKRAEGLGWYTDDAVLMTGGYVFQGKPELKTMFEQDPGHHPMQDIALKFARVEGNEQMVYVVKWVGWTLKNPVSGMDYTIPGKSLHVWQRQADGSWEILLDLNNMDIVL
ncbi:MAG: DUF4440 domain-containing protein [Sedimentisphaerales bacterium]|nr:DUF4440 domain-containing protein [Sedimentisphaerales bacterium]